MPIEITMPRLSDTMQAGTIVKWNVKPGQTVRSGDVVADIETDKATMELQTFDDGTVASLAVPEGRQVPVGTVILILAGKGENSAAIPAPSTIAVGLGTAVTATPPAATVAIAAAPAPAPAANGSNGHGIHDRDRVFASPLARKIAAERGIDLGAIEGSGPSGRIVRKDVEAAAASPKPAMAGKLPATAIPSPPIFGSADSPLTDRTVALSNMRRTIAARLVESKTTIPHYQVTISARVDALLTLRAQLNEQLASQGIKLSVNDFLVRACALAMHRHPYVNARWDDGSARPGRDAPDGPTIRLLSGVNIGVAIALDETKGGGLVVATIRDADRKGLRAVSSETRALAEKARARGLTIEEMSDSTFTISNLGMFGVDHFTAIINPPNVAILAVGAAIDQPVVETGPGGEKRLGIGTVMSMTMSSDHRVVDGAMAARYLMTVKEMLEKPATLLV
ncbi:MAG: 2-oxo acid dehydrogenase subunit E2 [Phycisphaerae bacterium]|nr:2-oxo acid dehydrogenase subunit E2 [Phycisphaerae bacterium]